MKIKSFVKAMVILLFIIILIAMAAGIGLYILNSPSRLASSQSVMFTVNRGESPHEFSKRLEDEGIINSALFFIGVSKVFKTETQFVAGTYLVKPGSTSIDIHNLFLSGKTEQIKITIPEGWTMNKIAGLCEKENLCTEKEFLSQSHSRQLLDKYGIPGENLEGFLFPDTYLFPPATPVEEILDEMVGNFFKKLELIVPDYHSMKSRKLYNKVIMASIIEREYRVPAEAPVIASVFYNRLAVDVGLESCATIEYIITEKLNLPHPEGITAEDKQINSPYNTYMWYGLPPGPISNPGSIALKAAFYPKKTDYWYFVLKNKDTGEHIFSKELEEHIKAKFQYKKGENLN